MNIFGETPASHIRRAQRRADSRLITDTDSMHTFRNALGVLGAITIAQSGRPTPRQSIHNEIIEAAKSKNPDVVVDLTSKLPVQENFRSVAADIAQTVFRQHPTHLISITRVERSQGPLPQQNDQSQSA